VVSGRQRRDQSTSAFTRIRDGDNDMQFLAQLSAKLILCAGIMIIVVSCVLAQWSGRVAAACRSWKSHWWRSVPCFGVRIQRRYAPNVPSAWKVRRASANTAART